VTSLGNEVFVVRHDSYQIRVARGSKFPDPTRLDPLIYAPFGTRPAGLSITGKVAELITS